MRLPKILDNGKLLVYGTVFKGGDSYRLTIPKIIANSMGLDNGRQVIIEYDFQEKKITIRKKNKE